MIFKQHIPNCVDLSRKPAPIEFNTLEELLSIPTVKSSMDSYDGRVFSYFAISDSHLMAVYNDGYRWWVVGSIYGDDIPSLNLPKWEPRYTEEYLIAQKMQQEAQREKDIEWFRKYDRYADGTKVYNEN